MICQSWCGGCAIWVVQHSPRSEAFEVRPSSPEGCRWCFRSPCLPMHSVFGWMVGLTNLSFRVRPWDGCSWWTLPAHDVAYSDWHSTYPWAPPWGCAITSAGWYWSFLANDWSRYWAFPLASVWLWWCTSACPRSFPDSAGTRWWTFWEIHHI